MGLYSKTIDNRWFVDVFPVGPLQCNCTIVADLLLGKSIVFDPGGNAQDILSRIQAIHCEVSAIICTHAHFDHILAAGELQVGTEAAVYLHHDDFQLWQSLELQCSFFNVPYSPIPDPNQWLADDQLLPCCDGVAIHTPGHTPGSMSFWFESACLLIAGDTLFKRSVGRTDLWGGDYAQIQQSIRERLYVLNEKAVVVTGHGDLTLIGDEKKMNRIVPFNK